MTNSEVTKVTLGKYSEVNCCPFLENGNWHWNSGARKILNKALTRSNTALKELINYFHCSAKKSSIDYSGMDEGHSFITNPQSSSRSQPASFPDTLSHRKGFGVSKYSTLSNSLLWFLSHHPGVLCVGVITTQWGVSNFKDSHFTHALYPAFTFVRSNSSTMVCRVCPSNTSIPSLFYGRNYLKWE